MPWRLARCCTPQEPNLLRFCQAKKTVEYLLDATRVDAGFARLCRARRGLSAARDLGRCRHRSVCGRKSKRSSEGSQPRCQAAGSAHAHGDCALAERLELGGGRERVPTRHRGTSESADAHAEYSFYLRVWGRFEEAIAAAGRTTALDPLSPDNLSQEGARSSAPVDMTRHSTIGVRPSSSTPISGLRSRG